MTKFPDQIRANGLKIVLVAGIGLATVACAPTNRVHGYVPDAELLDTIVPGVDTIASLETSIGRPSASGLVKSDAWYYVKSTVRHYTYNRPEVTDREVLAIRFAEDGVVEDVNRYGLEDGRIIDLKRKITVTPGQTLTALQQILGNFGQLSAGQIFSEDG